MRLSLFEIETIVKLKNRYFDIHDKIYLFGSRTDDSTKGGDIDLYLECDDSDTTCCENKNKFFR